MTLFFASEEGDMESNTHLYSPRLIGMTLATARFKYSETLKPTSTVLGS